MPTFDGTTKFSDWLYNELSMMGLSARAFSRQCGISQPTLSKYLRGIGQPKLTTFMKILKALSKEMAVDHKVIVFRK